MIELYQAMPGMCHFHCRFVPTCSQYAKEAISKYGAWHGTKLAIKRIFRCRPFGKYGYDLLVLHYDEYHENNNLYLIPNEKEPLTIGSLKRYIKEYFSMIYKMNLK